VKQTRARFRRARRQLRRLRSLRGGQVRLLASAWTRLLVVDLLVRLVGVQRTARLAPAALSTVPSGAQLACARDYAHWLRVAATHHVIRALCLHESLALHHWLRARGVPSAIDIGVRLDGAQLRAHAWFRVGDELVSDQPSNIVPFTRLAARGGTAWL
jgi:hypothetical protein